MAYRSILGGSPLGLIGVKSAATPDGFSSFNIDKSRNIKVQDYNISNAGTLFSGRRRIRAWADIKSLPTVKTDDGLEYQDITGAGTDRTTNSFPGQSNLRKTLHNDSVYDTSVLNIIEKLANTKGELKPADFAYLKNIGVYPNNRLMIARRFAAPSGDNIMVKKKPTEVGSLATLISWVPESEDFLNISFGEKWVDAEADFKNVLNSIGKDIGLENLGGIGGAAGNIVPLPGFTEIFQRQFLAKLGLLEDESANMIPAGNPNLIKEAKMRETIGYETAGSGLTCTVSVKMICEYELKYISGIDPTIVWMDLIGSILRFGTSESDTYGLSKKVSGKIISWANDPSLLLKEVMGSIKETITNTIDKVKEEIDKIYKSGIDGLKKQRQDEKIASKEDGNLSEGAKALASTKRASEGLLAQVGELLSGIADTLVSGVVQKYRVKIIGIINALSGLPSTPWHLTIGNPMRPIFCSGDMLTKDVNLKLGSQLAFNDLPSSITVEFTLENARPLGMQEIMAKFNSGYLRTLDVQKTYFETNQVVSPTSGKTYNEAIGALPGETSYPPDPKNDIGKTSSVIKTTDSANPDVDQSTKPTVVGSYAGLVPTTTNKDPHS